MALASRQLHLQAVQLLFSIHRKLYFLETLYQAPWHAMVNVQIQVLLQPAMIPMGQAQAFITVNTTIGLDGIVLITDGLQTQTFLEVQNQNLIMQVHTHHTPTPLPQQQVEWYFSMVELISF